MDPARTERITRELRDRTGVDFGRYRDPQLVEAIGNAVTFPLFLGRSLSRPVGLLLLLALLAFILTESAFLKTFLVFPGIVLVVLNGVLLGLVLFVRRIRDDMKQVFNISSNLCVQALKDIGTARSQLQNRPGGFPSLLEIFQGMNATVILPAVLQVLERKIPFLGGLAGKLTEKFFGLADRRLAAAIRKRAPEPPGTTRAEPAAVASWLDSAESAVGSIQGLIGRVVDGVARVVSFPFLAVLAVVAFISIGLLYGAYMLSG